MSDAPTYAELKKLVVEVTEALWLSDARLPNGTKEVMRRLKDTAAAIENAPETNEPYPLQRKDIDLSKHQVLDTQHSELADYTQEGIDRFPEGWLVVRDKPKPLTAEELVTEKLNELGLIDNGISGRGIRSAAGDKIVEALRSAGLLVEEQA